MQHESEEDIDDIRTRRSIIEFGIRHTEHLEEARVNDRIVNRTTYDILVGYR